MFDYKKAQKYELDWQEAYIKSELGIQYNKWIADKNLPIFPLTSWFAGDHVPFIYFIKKKIGIEVGCGSIPQFRYSHGLARRVVIDPLAADYARIQRKEWGGSFFDEVEIIAEPAERYNDELFESASVIVFRNALDHCEDPLTVLSNLSFYAKKGCYLLFWTDLWHNLGTDEGHRNITRSVSVMYEILEMLGWNHEAEIPGQHDNETDHIEIGGIWRMR